MTSLGFLAQGGFTFQSPSGPLISSSFRLHLPAIFHPNLLSFTDGFQPPRLDSLGPPSTHLPIVVPGFLAPQSPPTPGCHCFVPAVASRSLVQIKWIQPWGSAAPAPPGCSGPSSA